MLEGWGEVALLRVARALPAASENWHAVAAVSTVRLPNDGGELERALVAQYRCDAEALRFDVPRTAATLDRIADLWPVK